MLLLSVTGAAAVVVNAVELLPLKVQLVAVRLPVLMKMPWSCR